MKSFDQLCAEALLFNLDNEQMRLDLADYIEERQFSSDYDLGTSVDGESERIRVLRAPGGSYFVDECEAGRKIFTGWCLWYVVNGVYAVVGPCGGQPACAACGHLLQGLVSSREGAVCSSKGSCADKRLPKKHPVLHQEFERRWGPEGLVPIRRE